jgi:ABC-type polysaccharide/polyol phosphate export permease
MALARGAKPELAMEGGSTPRIADALRELWLFRRTVVAFGERDTRVKYKQAVLGIAWAGLQPLAYMLLFTLILGRYAGISGEGVPYAAFVFSALLPWFFLQNGVLFGTNSLVNDAPLLRKVYFPREVPILGTILASLVDFAFGLAVFSFVGPLLGAGVTWTWLLAVPLTVPLVVLCAAVALALGGVNVYYRDFRVVLPFLIQIWLFASPVAYPLSAVPDRWRNLYVAANPAAGIIDSFRRCLALGETPHATFLGISVAGTLVVAVIGYRMFKALEPSFADVV